MTAATRHCPICKDEIPATAHRNKKLCGKNECMAEQQRISGRKSYHKLLGHTEPAKKSCIVCGDDISGLRGNRVVCLKSACLKERKRRSGYAYFARSIGSPILQAQRRQSVQKYRANKPKVAKAAVQPTAAPKPARPTINRNLQRKPKESSKIQIRRAPAAKSRPAEADEVWMPRAMNLPVPGPAHTPMRITIVRSSFPDPWNCAMCREQESLCRLHQSLTDDGKEPPSTYQY